MSYRFMRMLIFFDLPTETSSDRRHYRLFRKMLIRNGFLMMQESVCCKLLLNTSAEKTAAEVIRKNKPLKGLVQMLTITEKQFAKSVGITLRDDYPDALERLLDYMELVRCYERNKLFIFVNLRSYFPDDSIQRFLQTAMGHQYTLLLVDAWEHPRLPEERRLIIDKDLCEI